MFESWAKKKVQIFLISHTHSIHSIRSVFPPNVWPHHGKSPLVFRFGFPLESHVFFWWEKYTKICEIWVFNTLLRECFLRITANLQIYMVWAAIEGATRSVCKRTVFEKFAIFTRKHLCWSIFFKKLQA